MDSAYPRLRLRAAPTLTSDFSGRGGGNFSHAGGGTPKGWVEASGTYVLDVATCPSKSLLAAAVSTRFSLRIYDIRGASLAPLKTLRGHKNRVTGVVFPSECDVFSCAEDGQVLRFDVRASSQKPVQTMSLKSGDKAFTSVDVGCGGSVVVAGTSEGSDSRAIFWDARSTGARLGEYTQGHTQAVTRSNLTR